ncbi:hypothetical protein C8Q79DRAFT_122818 [Trametes meyenii]|nr:hypothetical protein C8Q79DRAFT_122818 [Trametes meyenii]
MIICPSFVVLWCPSMSIPHNNARSPRSLLSNLRDDNHGQPCELSLTVQASSPHHSRPRCIGLAPPAHSRGPIADALICAGPNGKVCNPPGLLPILDIPELCTTVETRSVSALSSSSGTRCDPVTLRSRESAGRYTRGRSASLVPRPRASLSVRYLGVLALWGPRELLHPSLLPFRPFPRRSLDAYGLSRCQDSGAAVRPPKSTLSV